MVINCRFIKCVRDPWLPSDYPFKPRLFAALLNGITWVHQLIDRENGCWKEDLILSHFDPEDAGIILSIPISSIPLRDTLVLHYSSDGAFWVKSAYPVAKNALETSRAQAALQGFERQSINDPLWKQTWKIQVPDRLKVFLWRALQNGLAVGDNLSKRIPDLSPQCATCLAGAETVLHLFSGCSKARQVWLLSPLALRSDDIPGATFLEWWKNLYRDVANISHIDDPMAFACVLCWRLWKARNDKIFNDKEWSAQDIINKAVVQLLEFANCQESFIQLIAQSHSEQPPSSSSWQRPPHGVIKINFDGAFTPNGQKGSIGIVARDSSGAVVQARNEFLRQALNPSLVEAQALRAAILLASAINHHRFIVEGDAKLVLDAFRSRKFNSEAHIVLRDAARLLDCSSMYDFIYVNRACNWIAYDIAH